MSENSEKESPNTLNDNKTTEWKWTEPSNEQFEELRKSLIFYRIYTIENGKSRNLFKFWGKDDREALLTLAEFKESHPEYGDNCFYSTSGYVTDPDGTRHDTLFDIHERKDGPVMKIIDFFRYSVPHKISDFIFKIKDTIYFFRHEHSITESWSLDSHILEDLRFNLKKLSENPNGCPSFICEKARVELKKPESKDGDYDNYVMNLAIKMWSDELDKLREEVLLYTYYSEYGIVSNDDKDMVDIDKRYKDTLPYKPGTNKEFDYAKLNALSREHWNNIWDWIKEYGEHLWD